MKSELFLLFFPNNCKRKATQIDNNHDARAQRDCSERTPVLPPGKQDEDFPKIQLFNMLRLTNQYVGLDPQASSNKPRCSICTNLCIAKLVACCEDKAKLLMIAWSRDGHRAELCGAVPNICGGSLCLVCHLLRSLATQMASYSGDMGHKSL